MMIGRFCPLPARVIMLALAAMCLNVHAPGQAKTDSPVFKKYRPPPEPPLVEPSDALWQIWQTFLVTRRANAGDVVAQHELGIRYLIGRGAAPDTVKAAEWIRKAALQNYLPARFNFGILCYHGWGIPWDPFAAYHNFKNAAERGMPEAEFAMAQFESEDLIVPRNDSAAYAWVKMAADSGYAPAKEAIKQIERQVTGGGSADSARRVKAPPAGLVFLDFPSDTTTASNDSLLLREAIRSAGPALQKALGMKKILEGDIQTDSVTIAGLRDAADAGSPEALTILGRAFATGRGAAKNVVRACAYYVRAVRLDAARAPELLYALLQEKGTLAAIKAASAQGDPEASFAWAGCAGLGFDLQLLQGQSYIAGDQALGLFRTSGEKGYLPALVETGLCYYAGRWVAPSREKALEIWRDAAERGSVDARIRVVLTLLRDRNDTADIGGAIAALMTASEAGSVLAQVGLGFCFETGTGVPEFKAVAARYYRAAWIRGSQDAYRALRRMHDAIRPPEAVFKLED